MGPEFNGDPNIVEVYVGYLRKKIDAPFYRHSIETVRGLGYRLVIDERGIVPATHWPPCRRNSRWRPLTRARPAKACSKGRSSKSTG